VPEADLGRLLGAIDARLEPGTYIFCVLAPGERPQDAGARLVFQEAEGTTVVVALVEALRRGWRCAFPCEWIVLGAPSDLGAVGFLAAVLAELARAGIAVNAVSAFHHDHLFVPEGRGAEAVAILADLERRHRPHGAQP
jgi:uncharacterized protein